MYIYVCMYVCVCMWVCVCVCVYECECVCVGMHIHIHRNAYLYIYLFLLLILNRIILIHIYTLCAYFNINNFRTRETENCFISNGMKWFCHFTICFNTYSNYKYNLK